VRKPGREPIIVNCFDQMEPASAPRRHPGQGAWKKFSITHHIPKLQPCAATHRTFEGPMPGYNQSTKNL